MTEQEWLTCTDPAPMLDFLRSSGSVSDRKLRLFVVACCRHADHLFPTERGQSILETAEWFAEALSAAELWEEMAAGEVPDDLTASRTVLMGLPPWWAMLMALQPGATHALPQFLRWLARAVGKAANDTHAALRASPGEEVRAARQAWSVAVGAGAAERRFQCDLLRDIFDPFHPAQLNLAWLTPAVVVLARDIYGHRNFAGLPDLADVLQWHGCTSADILDHLRSPGPHVLGCWCLDLLLGKE